MIYISGMEDGSGDGNAASVKAGWLPRRPGAVAAVQAVLPALLRAAISAPAPADQSPRRAPVDRPVRQAPPKPRPALGPDGRPLPPDGSAPPLRPQTGPIPATNPAPVAQGTPAPVLTPDGRPIPPVGAPPARPQRTSTAPGRQHTNTGPPVPAGPPNAAGPATRMPGTPLPPGTAPSAPAGHTFTARPVPAPAGEFLFDVRCSCGRNRLAPVTRDDLKRAAEHGLAAADAISIATQDALDAAHS